MRFFANLATSFALANVASALSSSLQHVTGFSAGPTAAGMYVYIPTTKAASAPIIVAIHYCTGTANAYFSGTQYATYADTYGYIVIYPNSPSSGGCWDVSSTASLTHNGGGDSETIVNMVSYAIANYGGDASRVYVTGTSSGAMMTNVLAAAYPNIFKAGSAYSGVAAGCFYVAGATAGMATPAWNSQCAEGDLIQSASAWGAQARSYYPGYTGSYPKMLLWHGTIDATLYYPNLGEELKEWSNLLGVSFSHNNTNTPQSGYTQMAYGDGTKLIGYSALSVGHTVPVHETVDLAWFCISSPCSGGSGSGSGGGSSTGPTTMQTSPSPIITPTSTPGVGGGSTCPTTTTGSGSGSGSGSGGGSSGGGSIAEWGQCGGIGWSGSGTCVSGTTCTYSNAYYSQCLPS